QYTACQRGQERESRIAPWTARLAHGSERRFKTTIGEDEHEQRLHPNGCGSRFCRGHGQGMEDCNGCARENYHEQWHKLCDCQYIASSRPLPHTEYVDERQPSNEERENQYARVLCGGPELRKIAHEQICVRRRGRGLCQIQH